MARLGGFELDPSDQRPPPIDYSKGRMSREEINEWLHARGFEAVVPELDPSDPSSTRGRELEAFEAGPDVKMPALNYQLRTWHRDQYKDWTPYMEEEFASAHVRDVWTRVKNVTSPKDLAGIAGQLLGSPACIPEAWPIERRNTDLQPFWQAYQVCCVLVCGILRTNGEWMRGFGGRSCTLACAVPA